MLRLRIRVCHDPRARLQPRDTVREDDRPDRDARVHLPTREHVADGAGVRAAAIALELGHDLHRTDFRGAGDRPGREAGAEEVEGRDAFLQLAGHLGDEVRHVREALGLEEARDLDARRLADAREVVAAEVDEHHVLGAVLLGGEQPLGVPLAGVRRAGDRVQARAAVLALDERLRRRADQRQAAELEQEEVGGGIDPAQRPVELERRGGRRPLRPLREHDLERIPGADVLADPLHALFVRGLVGRAPHG